MADECARLAAWSLSGYPLLDTREDEHFASRRLNGRVAHIPWRRLHDEAFMLPPREVAFALLVRCPRGCVCSEAAVSHCLEGCSCCVERMKTQQGVVRFSDLCTESEPSCYDVIASFSSARSPWEITHVFVDTPALWAAAAVLDLQAATIVSSPLWKPTQVLEDLIDRIEAGTDSRFAMDLGCGSGRDVCFLALRGWDVCAVDNMPKALDRVKRMSKKFETSGQIRTECLDVKRQISRLPELLGTNGVDLLLVVRFFHRAMLPELAALVKPGGFVLFSHFRDGVQHHPIGSSVIQDRAKCL
uniref:Tellurite resistance methyltransferase TehB-like domain-containing protein n=1 Tax=Noctiluca scintillans TaxID=2966 RepID=A0A7S1FAR3_NOCSC